VARQQEPAASDDPKVVEAQKRQALAEAEKARAEAERDAYKAKIGEISTDKLPKGTITAEKLEIEGRILAYRSADNSTTAIVTSVGSVVPKPGKVVLFSSKELNGLMTYQAFSAQTNLLIARVPLLTTMPPLLTDHLTKPCSTTPRKFVPPLLAVDTALQVLALFKVDTSIAGAEVTLDDFAIYAMIASKLRASSIDVVYLPSYYPNVFGPPPPALKIYKLFGDLNQKQFDLGDFSATIDQRKADLAKRQTAETDNACKALYQVDLDALAARQTEVKETQTLLGQIIAGLTKPDDQTGLNLIHTFATAEQLATAFPSAYLLQVKPIAAGGSTKTTTNILGSKLSFSGGSIISFMLFDTSGAVVAAGTSPLYGGYVRDKKMK